VLKTLPDSTPKVPFLIYRQVRDDVDHLVGDELGQYRVAGEAEDKVVSVTFEKNQNQGVVGDEYAYSLTSFLKTSMWLLFVMHGPQDMMTRTFRPPGLVILSPGCSG